MSIRTRQVSRSWRALFLDPPTGLKYAVAVLAALAGLAIRSALEPTLGAYSPYLPSILALIIAARFGGRKPAFVAATISALGISYLFLEPRYSLAITDTAAKAGLALFVAVAFFICVLVGDLRESLLATARTEAALRRKTQLIDLSHDAVITADAHRVITGWNSGATEMYGWTEPEALGKPIHQLLQSKNHVLISEIDSVLDREGRWSGELIHTARDGRQVISDCRIVLMPGADGVPTAMLATNRDITNRKRAQEELETEHRKNIAILESISDGFNAFDRQWRYTYVNEPAAKMLGKTPGELLGKVLWDLWPQAADSAFGAAFRRAVAENIPVRVEEFYPAPLNRWFEVRCYPSPEGLSLFFSDTTERHHTEERLRQTQKLESIGVLAGGVAHDFNNILTVIMGSASEALAQCSTCEHSQAILLASKRAAYLTKQLLAYAGKGQAIKAVVDLRDLISQAEALLSAAIPKRVTLGFELSRDLACLEMDPSQVEQILMNLVINAGEAIPPKSDGQIVVAARNCAVTSEIAHCQSPTYDVAPGPYVCLEVRDNGTGIDQTTAANIFDPFFTTKFTGRGLGLAAIQGIVRASKGFVELRSSPDTGTTFQVFLPASEKKPSMVRARTTAPSQSRGPTTILVVDDEEMVRKMACTILKRYGYQVQEARDGRDALRVLAESSSLPSLALLDLAMPVMGGDELVPILEAQYPGIKIIMSSGYPEDEARKISPFDSVAGFLKKPYTGVTLAEKVARVLEDL
jgi:two-component system, cell cycle sensor histidine kinase and response regulator CckA